FLSAFAIGQPQVSLEYLTTGSLAKAITLLVVIVLLFFRPNGLFATKVRR
ncbi:urea ABC transporter permease subunit UrtB, partial [Pseudomonas syringae]|nr:urea ABC transporter permease subunit UrtB [Pseudomonas syringae]